MKSPLFDVKGWNAIITGGNRGIGLTIAKTLASLGVNIVIVDLDERKDIIEKLEQCGVRALSIPADVSVKRCVDKMVKEVLKELGRIDILVNNAGIAIRKLTLDMTEEDWDRTISINLKGVFLCSQTVVREGMMKRRRGKIINVSSVLSLVGLADGRSAYGASKAGVSQLTKAMALEWASYNINVNAIAPGSVKTAMNKEYFEKNPEVIQRFIDKIPLARIAKPEDLIGAVIFLASPASNYITGQTIFVDGGWTIW